MSVPEQHAVPFHRVDLNSLQEMQKMSVQNKLNAHQKPETWQDNFFELAIILCFCRLIVEVADRSLPISFVVGALRIALILTISHKSETV